MTSTQNRTNTSEVFAIAQQISSQINKDRIQEAADKAKALDVEDNQLVVDILGTVCSYPSPIDFLHQVLFRRPSRKTITT
jgi:hypothetical protein